MTEEKMTLKLLEFFQEYNFKNELNEEDELCYDKILEHFSQKHHIYKYSKEALKEKENDYKNKRQFYCPHCPKKVYKFDGLKNHLRMHEIELYGEPITKKFPDEYVFAISKDGETNRIKFLADKCFDYLKGTVKICSENYKENSVSIYFLACQEDDYILGEFKKDDLLKMTLEELEELSERINEENMKVQNDSSDYWSDSSGVKINYKNMEDRHIENSLRKLFRDNVEDVFEIEVYALTLQKKKRIENGTWKPVGNLGLGTDRYLQYCNKHFPETP